MAHRAQSTLAVWLLIAASFITVGCQSALLVSRPSTLNSRVVNESAGNQSFEVSAGQVFHSVSYINQMNMPATMRAPADIVLKYSFELTLRIAAGDELVVFGETSVDGQPALLVRLKDGGGSMKLLVGLDGAIMPKLVAGEETLPYSLRVLSGPHKLEPGSRAVVVAREMLVFTGATDSNFRFLVRLQDAGGSLVEEMTLLAPRKEKMLSIRGHRFELQSDLGTSLVLRLLATAQDWPKSVTKKSAVAF